MHTSLASFLTCIALLSPSPGLSQEPEWAPSSGAYGACSWLANPAALAVHADGVWELHVLGASGVVANDALNLSLYRKYNGKFLSTENKEDILDAVSGPTIEGAASGCLDVLGLRVGRFGFSTRTFAGLAIELDKDFLELLFFGNELSRRYKLMNAGSSLAYSSFGVSYARPAGEAYGWAVAAGAAVRYVVGWEAAELVESHGQVVTEPTGVTGWGESRVRYSERRGRGVTFDVGGWAAKGNWEIGAAFRELGPAIRWPAGREETYRFEIDGWTFEDGDTLYNEEKHTRDIGRWFTPLPTCLEVLAAHHRDWGSVSLRWMQGLRDIGGMTTAPRFRMVGSWVATPWIKPWLGLEVGSPEGFSLPLGFGLQFGPVGFNTALTGCRLPPSDSKALGLALSISAGSSR
jgi:hypothetical protein